LAKTVVLASSVACPLYFTQFSQALAQDAALDTPLFSDLAKEAQQEQQQLANDRAQMKLAPQPQAAKPAAEVQAAAAAAKAEAPAGEAKASVDLDKAMNQLAAEKAALRKESQAMLEPAKKEPERKSAIKEKTLVEEESPAAIAKPVEQLPAVITVESQPARSAGPQVQNAAAAESANAETKRQLEASQRRASALSRELEETRNRLIIAETEVERLSNVLAERNKASLAKYSPNQARTSAGSAPAASRVVTLPLPRPQQEKMADDMLIATVVVDKVNLRTGPGKDNSPLMTVSKGTRLAIETRNGEWYRVVSPTGARAWVSSEGLAFGPNGQDSPTSTIKIKGYDSHLEDEASRIIRQELQ
jgi:hypothetical protein